MKRILLPLTAFASTLGVTPAPPEPLAVPLDPQVVIKRMAAGNQSLQSYQSRVHVRIRLLSFPFLTPTLDGTSYYRRPDTYVVVFDRMPSYAKGFSRIFDDVGNPEAWEKEQNVTFEGTTVLHARQTVVLRLTKKIHSDILDHTLAYVDAQTYQLEQMEWYYTNGGFIVMSQQYRLEGGYAVLASQHASIRIPFVHAVADAQYGTYQINGAAGAKATP